MHDVPITQQKKKAHCSKIYYFNNIKIFSLKNNFQFNLWLIFTIQRKVSFKEFFYFYFFFFFFFIEHFHLKITPSSLPILNISLVFPSFNHQTCQLRSNCQYIIFGHLMLLLRKKNKGGYRHGVMVKAMNCGIVVREFVLQSRYYE